MREQIPVHLLLHMFSGALLCAIEANNNLDFIKH
jgi:hypothetical protein